jgi:hypothetical protein
VTRSTITTMKALIDHGSGKHAREDKPRTVIQSAEKLWNRNISLTQRLVDTSTIPMLRSLSMLKVPMRDRIPLSVCRRDGRARFNFI